MTAIQITKDLILTYKPFLDLDGKLEYKDIKDFCDVFESKHLTQKVKSILEKKGYTII